jgi:polyhydroxyalkanoate synthesis regulator phasin
MSLLDPSKLDPSKDFELHSLEEESVKIPYLVEKFLFDLTDGLKVVENKLCFRSNPTNILRFVSLFDGSYERRQQIIDQGFFGSVDTLNTCVKELIKHGNFTNESITKISDNLSTTIGRLTQVANYSFKTREILQELKQTFSKEVRRLDDKIDEVKTDVDAQRRINEVIWSWRSGNYCTGYSPLIQAVFALNDLARDKIGRFIYTHHRSMMLDAIVTTLGEKVHLSSKKLVRLQDCLSCYAKPSSNYQNRVAVYLIGKENDDLLYHRLLAEYIESRQIPKWLTTKQEAEMSVMLSINLLIDHFASELG